MAIHSDLFYVPANGLLNKMSLQTILELTTESLHAIEGVEEDVQDALDYLDGVGLTGEQLSDAARHIAFVVLDRLKTAEGLVNSYGARRYDIPMLASDGRVPSEIVDAVLTVARFKLHNRRSSLPDDVAVEYEQALLWLERLSKGVVVLSLHNAGDTLPQEARSRAGLSDRTSVTFNGSLF